MKSFTSSILTAILVLSSAVSAPAQQTQPTTAPTDQNLPVEARLFPGERLGNVRLDDVLDYIRDRVPDFNAVVIREAGVPDDYPTLPQLDLRNVTIGQFMTFIGESFANVSVKLVPGPFVPLYVVQIRSGGPGLPVIDAPARPQSIVRVYRLREITDALISQSRSATTQPADGTTARTQAISHVLSVVQAALEQAGEKTQPVLKVHEPTLTLIFKGTESQQFVLEEALRALQGRTEG
ncbi:hypothetical protein [Fontivita pretiosa]|uniref:hypothetical protein n=1 Tax=Fontivita pretiosa TaxID=2989684 RepID=UPI003D178AE9